MISNKPFKVVSKELKFYRKKGIPIPHVHADDRFTERVKMSNKQKLFIVIVTNVVRIWRQHMLPTALKKFTAKTATSKRSIKLMYTNS